jgi:hypothetical protein
MELPNGLAGTPLFSRPDDHYTELVKKRARFRRGPVRRPGPPLHIRPHTVYILTPYSWEGRPAHMTVNAEMPFVMHGYDRDVDGTPYTLVGFTFHMAVRSTSPPLTNRRVTPL